jgi:protein-tyrosine phosphatase
LTQNPEHKEKVRLLINNDIVPDPYYDDSLFEPVFQLINANCVKLLTQLENEKG